MQPNRTREPEDQSLFRQLLSVTREERASVGYGIAAFFCLLFALFLLKPLRDELGLRGGASNLKRLWTVTLAGTVVTSLAFAALASRFDRRTFLSWSWRAVALVWLAFLPALLLSEGVVQVWVARAFYVTHAVTNVFVVSLFWALLADLFDEARARRLFALIAVGGTLGALVGPAVTGVVAARGGALWLIVPAALSMELAVRFAAAQARRTPQREGVARKQSLALGGDMLEGLRLVARKPYLQGIALFTFAFGVVQTFFTLQQKFTVEATLAAGDARAEYFAWTETATQTLTLVVQLFVTGRLMRRLGVGGALAVLPVVGVLGFGALWTARIEGWSALSIVTVCIVAWRGLHHSVMRPGREALYVPTERAEKFKAKSFTDTFAFRGGDLASAWSFDVVSLTTAAALGVPMAAAWGALGWWLARRQVRLTAEQAALEVPASPSN